MGRIMVEFFKKTFQYRGRATRKEFWIPNIILMLIGILLNCFNRYRGIRGLEDMAAAAIILPSISLTSRRYQDAGISGWFQLPQYLSILLLPVIFMRVAKRWLKMAVITAIAAFNLLGFIFTLLPGEGDNKYGKG
ncbi:DUF805 domain-containing protein [Salinicoccus albus]|uniref:DUF805 domain-containing protein n=1 Tax=Salinicoccus albus TaxID=418756 RepID=UPI0003794181|nr:DUF805 domain-containing protein [Salinicoccus albus]